jgi:cobalt-zinc-cadmium efflux system protein
VTNPTHHGSHIPQRSDGGLSLTAWLTGFYFIVEFGIGLYTGSISVLSDAFHTFSAVGGILLALVAARIARRSATPERSFGFGRAEIIGALLNGVFLFLMAVVVMWMGYMRLRQPIELSTMPMLAAAFGGLVIEFISLRALYVSQKDDLNVRGAYWHVLQTFVGSLIIIIAVVVIELTGFLAIDPILGMVFGVVLLFASWALVRDALVVLLEATPADIDLNEVGRSLLAIDGVSDIHHIHAWTITSGKNVFSTHLRLEHGASDDTVLAEAHRRLTDEFEFYFSTVQLENHCTDLDEVQEIDITRVAVT